MARNFLLLVGLGQLLFGSDFFWFSYKIVTVNGAAIFEEKNITPAMMPFEGKPQKHCTVELKYDAKTPKNQFLTYHFDAILPCFYSLSSHMLSWNESRTKENKDRVELIIEPVRFTVDFKDEFATINTFR